MSKIKIEIDLSDYFTDNEESLDYSIKNAITAEVYNVVWSRIRDSVEREITSNIERNIIEQSRAKIGKYIDEFVKTGLLNTGTAQEIKIDDFLRDKIANSKEWLRKI